MTLSSAEQLAIELINRLRLDPEGEAVRLGIDDPAERAALGLPEGPVSGNRRLANFPMGALFRT